ncbi:MAG: M24 family metallopeptidase [Patescibacteria group bacterium]
MSWTNQELQSHLRAAKILDQIKNQSFEFIRKNPATTEYAVQKFIRHLFKENNLRLAEHSPIVAFGKNTSFIHYFLSKKTSQKLLARRSFSKGGKPNSPILIDLWSRFNKHETPFADITWMGFYGRKIPNEFQKIYDLVIKSRDACLEYLKTELKKGKIPTGAKLDDVARNVIKKAGYERNFTHSTGHSLGFVSPHGKGEGLSFRNSTPLEINLGYTIEPGIYLKNKFGARSEINFYINSKFEVVVTSKIQNKLVLIKP